MSDCKDCLASGPGGVSGLGSDACRRCLTIHYLLPIFEKELARLTKIRIGPFISPKPGPDPSPVINFGAFERDLIRAVAGDPNPQPNVFPREMRLKAATVFRKALTETLTKLDKEIESLQK